MYCSSFVTLTALVFSILVCTCHYYLNLSCFIIYVSYNTFHTQCFEILKSPSVYSSSMDILDILAHRSTVRVLLFLLDHKETNEKEIVEGVDKGATSIHTAIDILAFNELMVISQSREYGEKKITLSATGLELASKLKALLDSLTFV